MASIAAGVSRDVKITGLVCGAHSLSHFYWLVLPPLFPVLRDAFDVSYAALGLVLTGFGIAAGFGQTPIGFVVDRVGGRRVLLIGLAVQSAAIGLIGVATDYWQLLVLYTLAGAAHTVYHPADYAILSASVPKGRLGKAYGVHSFTGNLGFALAPIVMVGIASFWHWRAAFIAVGLIGLAYAAVMVWNNDLLDDDSRARAARVEAGPAPTGGSGASLDGIALLLSLPVLMCFLYFVLQQLGTGGLRMFIVAAMDTLYATPLAVTNAGLSGLMFGMAFGILAGGALADRVGPAVWFAAVTLLPAALLIALLGVVELPAYLLVAVLVAVGALTGALVPSRDLLIRAVTPDGSMGKVMGFASSGLNLAAGLVPILFGWLMDIGEVRWIFWISACFIAGTLVTFTVARARMR